MSNGSHDREDVRDVQCAHCGRFYRNDGVKIHERNCPYSEVDDTIVDLPDQDQGTEPLEDVVESTPTPQDGEAMAPTPEAPDPSDPDADGGDPLRTDGGPSDPPAPPEPVDDQEDQDDEDLPDGYQPVNDWVDDYEDEHEDVVDDPNWQHFRDDLLASEADAVDLEETDVDEGTLVAVEESEI